MDTLKAIQTRNSIPHLEDPAPSHQQMSEVYKGALRAPDHAWLRPWKFIEVRRDGRERLGKIFLETGKSLNADLSEIEKDKLLKLLSTWKKFHLKYFG